MRKEASARAIGSSEEVQPRKIVRLGTDKLVKYGPPKEIELEAHTMRYIAANTTIPVPHVYDIGVHSNGLKSIVMEHINGLTLHEAWSNMIPSQKVLVAEQIHGYILQLRELKPHSESTSLRTRNQGIYSLNSISNPEHQTQLNEQLFARMTPLVPDILQSYASPNRKDELVFTHGDLAPRNIVVDGEAHVTAMLDWEYAGWYPQCGRQ